MATNSALGPTMHYNDTNTIPKEELRRIGPQISQPPNGATLIEWLSKNFSFFTKDQWQTQIDANFITINQQIVTDGKRLLALGDQIARIHPLNEEPNVNTNLEIIWLDGDFAAINKPAGLPMHESAYFRRKTVHWLIKGRLSPEWDAAHRLDRETSGIVLCGRTQEARKQLALLIENRKAKKTYLALCQGLFNLPSAIWIDKRSIIPAKGPTDKATCLLSQDDSDSFPASQTAETHFQWTSSLTDKLHLIEAQPITGRTHQIRVHLANSGLPILGDKIYGPNEDTFKRYISEGNSIEVQKMAGAPNHCLHASKIEFLHPVANTNISITTPIPDWAKKGL
ncbi:MAG: RluA family pseudouridine synthase [Proteobacteria bacterium]|nr:RluA family pseudouridine synthase [Pseudomonadota bacterium]